jgi:molecular chaperone IbpA
MRTYNFAPLFRSTIGFDRLLELMNDNTPQPDGPRYNIEKMGETRYRIRMAMAGFSAREVEMTQQGNALIVTGQKIPEQDQHEMLHQGLAFRDFRQSFSLADHVKVASANLENGLLSIELLQEVPEELKPRRIDITTGGGTGLPARDIQPKLLDQGQHTKAA